MSIVEWANFLYDGALRDYLFTYLSQQKTKQMREVARAIGVTPDQLYWFLGATHPTSYGVFEKVSTFLQVEFYRWDDILLKLTTLHNVPSRFFRRKRYMKTYWEMLEWYQEVVSIEIN